MRPRVEDQEPAGDEAAAAEWTRAWALYDDQGNQVTDISQLNVEDALSKLAIGYNANGELQHRSLDEIIRLAQRLPFAEDRAAQLQTQRNEVDTKFAASEVELDGLRKDKKFWLWVMQDPTGERFQKALNEFQTAQFEDGPQTDAPPDEAPQLFTAEENQQGELIYQQHFRPVVQRIAASYSLDGQVPAPEVSQHLEGEIEQAFRVLANQEGRFLADPQYGPARLREMFELDLPQLLAEAGCLPVAQANGTGSTNGADPISAENERLKAELANVKAQRAREKVSDAPDAGMGGQTPASAGAGADLGKIKSYQDIKKMLDDPMETFGM